MDKIIDEVKKREGNRMKPNKVNIVCYADDTLLVVDNEDDLQRQLHTRSPKGVKWKAEA